MDKEKGSIPLGTADNLQFVLGGGTGKDDFILPKDIVPLRVSQGINLFTVHHNGMEFVLANFFDGLASPLGYHGFGVAKRQVDLTTNGFSSSG